MEWASTQEGETVAWVWIATKAAATCSWGVLCDEPGAPPPGGGL